MSSNRYRVAFGKSFSHCVFAGLLLAGCRATALDSQVTVDARQPLRSIDARVFGVNTAVWDPEFDTATTLSLLRESEMQALRFPGGSTADDYHFASNTSGSNVRTWTTSFDRFAHIATNIAAQVFITVNYGSGTALEASNWVYYANKTKGYRFKNWEIGNENYGTWEHDTNARPNDAFTYANRAKSFITAMKGAYPTIRVGVPVSPGEDSFSNGYSDHPALNPRTRSKHNGWTPVLLSTLKSIGVTPDFLIHHRYPQEPGQESDAGLLTSTTRWSSDATDLRRQLTDYLGAEGTKVELMCTENNSVSYNPGKQTTSLINALYLVDSTGQLLKTEFRSLIWWDFRNSDESNNNEASLYGWRDYGDYGMISRRGERHPSFYAAKLLKNFARGGDVILTSASSPIGGIGSLLSVYAARRTHGTLTLLVINKSASSPSTASIELQGFVPDTSAVLYRYGIPQDEAARTHAGLTDVSETPRAGVSSAFAETFPPLSATVIVFSPAGARLSVPADQDAAGPLRIGATGQPGAPYRLERSNNLIQWTTVSTNQSSTGQFEFLDASSPRGAQRFYRAIWQP